MPSDLEEAEYQGEEAGRAAGFEWTGVMIFPLCFDESFGVPVTCAYRSCTGSHYCTCGSHGKYQEDEEAGGGRRVLNGPGYCSSRCVLVLILECQ